MKKLTKIINGILGAGNNRRTIDTVLKVDDAPIWEVRRKHNRLTDRQRAAEKS